MTRVDATAFKRDMLRASGRIGSIVADGLRTAALQAQTRARTSPLYKSHTYGLRGSISLSTIDAWHQRLIAAAPYAGFVEYGTKPHKIEAKGGMLRFEVGGSIIFRRSVNHPGTKPRPFMATSRDLVIPTLLGLLTGAITKAMR